MSKLDQVWLCNVPGCGRFWKTAYLASWHEAKMHDSALTCWPATCDPLVSAHQFLTATPGPAGPARTP